MKPTVDISKLERDLTDEAEAMARRTYDEQQKALRKGLSRGQIADRLLKAFGRRSEIDAYRCDAPKSMLGVLNLIMKIDDFNMAHAFRKDVIELSRIEGGSKTVDELMADYMSGVNVVVKETEKNAQRVAKELEQATKRVREWGGHRLRIKPVNYEMKDIDYTEGWHTFDVKIGKRAGFTVWTNGKLEVGDVLEAGDTDFFKDPIEQMNYFDLVRELEKPGSTKRPGKDLVLWTARPTKDRKLYQLGKKVPTNIFLTTDPNRAAGIAHDLGSGEVRDLWRVVINELYLMKTLDTGRVRDYQTIGKKDVPVKSMTLAAEGESIEMDGGRAMSLAEELRSIIDEAMISGVTSYDIPGPTKKGMPRKRRAPAPKAPSVEAPDVDATYAQAHAVKDQAGLKRIFDSLKPKQVVWVSYRSVMGGIGHQGYRPYTIGRRSKSKKYDMTSVTLLHKGQTKAGPSGMQTKLYRRGDGDVEIALGDMAATLRGVFVVHKGEDVEVSLGTELSSIIEGNASAGMSMAVAMAQGMMNKQTRELDKKATTEMKKLVRKYVSYLENATGLNGWKTSVSYGLVSLDNEGADIYIDIYWEGDPGNQRIDVTVEMTKGKKSKFHYAPNVQISPMGLSPLTILGDSGVRKFLKENMEELLLPLFVEDGKWFDSEGRRAHDGEVYVMNEDGDLVKATKGMYDLTTFIKPTTRTDDIIKRAITQASAGKMVKVGSPAWYFWYDNSRNSWAVSNPKESYPTFFHGTDEAAKYFVKSWINGSPVSKNEEKGIGARGGLGPGGKCVCPSCGHEESHVTGEACLDMVCPKCGTKMMRENEDASVVEYKGTPYGKSGASKEADLWNWEKKYVVTGRGESKGKKKAAHKGERQAAKKEIQARMRGEGDDGLAVELLSIIEGKPCGPVKGGGKGYWSKKEKKVELKKKERRSKGKEISRQMHGEDIDEAVVDVKSYDPTEVIRALDSASKQLIRFVTEYSQYIDKAMKEGSYDSEKLRQYGRQVSSAYEVFHDAVKHV